MADTFVALGTLFDNTNNNGQIAYSSDAVNWYPVPQSAMDDLFINVIQDQDVTMFGLGYGKSGGSNIFVATGYTGIGNNMLGQIGWSFDGKTWTKVTDQNLGSLVGNFSYGGGVAYNYSVRNPWVVVGGNGNKGLIGYSDDGLLWNKTDDSLMKGLFGVGNEAQQGGANAVAAWAGGFVAVGCIQGGDEYPSICGQIGFLDIDRTSWYPVKKLYMGTFCQLFGQVTCVCAVGNSFVAGGFGMNGSGEIFGQIAFAYDVINSADTNDLFLGTTGGGGMGDFYGACFGLAYDGTTLFACGRGYENNSLIANGQIGYSKDGGRTWYKVPNSNMGGLFQGRAPDAGGTCTSIAYDGKGTWTVVGIGYAWEQKPQGQIGYSQDGGRTWVIGGYGDNINSTNVNNNLLTSIGGGRGGGGSVTYSIILPIPSKLPISNICFPSGTPIRTDQGIIPIEQINRLEHTLGRQSILYITQTTTLDNYLICFPKDSIYKNYPNEMTIMTKDHKIEYNGQLIPAYRFLNISDKIKKVKYSGEILYNILLKDYSTMNVNNLICETLHPENVIAKLYTNNFSDDYRQNVINIMNNALNKRDINSYKNIIKRF